MKIKIILICALLIALLMPQAQAAERKLYEQWHRFQDEFVYKDQVYSIRMFPDDIDRLRLEIDDQSYFITYAAPNGQEGVSNDNCAINGAMKVCYTQKSYDFKYKSDFDSQENQVPGVRITIYELFDKTQIKISKKLEPSKLHIGERGTINVEISNDGELIAYNMKVQEFIPEGLEFTGSGGVDNKLGSTLNILRHLPPGQTIKYDYSFDMRSFDTQEAITNYSWQFEGSNITVLDSTELEVRLTGWKAEYEWDKNEIDSNEVVSLKISIENDGEEADDVNIKKMSVKFPRELIITPVSSEIFQTAPNTFVITDEVPAQRSKEYVLNAYAEFTGEYNTIIDLEAESQGDKFFDTENLTLKVGKGDIVPVVSVSPETIRAGNEIRLLATLHNDELENLYNVQGNLVAYPVYEQEFSYDKITPDELIKINTKNDVRMPISQQQKTIKFSLNGTFETATGEVSEFSTQKSVLVKPSTESFQVTIAPTKQKMNIDEENTIQVNIKNLLGDAVVDVNIQDTFSRPVQIISGETKEVLDIQGGDTEQAYIYKFSLPKNFPDDTLEITTEISSDSKDYREVYITTIPVNITIPQPIVNPDNPEDPENPDNNGENNPDNPEDPENPEPIDENESIWAKIGNFFKFLFTKR